MSHSQHIWHCAIWVLTLFFKQTSLQPLLLPQSSAFVNFLPPPQKKMHYSNCDKKNRENLPPLPFFCVKKQLQPIFVKSIYIQLLRKASCKYVHKCKYLMNFFYFVNCCNFYIFVTMSFLCCVWKCFLWIKTKLSWRINFC